MKIIHSDGPDYSDKTPTAGYYVYDGEYHGPWAERDDAELFVAWCEADDAIERRHIRSLGV